MQKEIKKIIKGHLRNCEGEWCGLVKDYYKEVQGTAKGIVLKWHFFKNKNYWRCLNELQKIKIYGEKDNFYKIASDILSDIALRASFKGLINPYEYELEK